LPPLRALKSSDNDNNALRSLRSFDASDITIAGLIPLDEICDEFVCKSSPAVEGSLRQIARDIVSRKEAGRSMTPFANDVVFDDGARRFVGKESYAAHSYIADNVAGAAAAVESMKMLGLDMAEVKWRLQGTNPGGNLDVKVTAMIQLNLITGRAVSHTEEWDMSLCDSNAATFLNFTRVASAVPKNLADAASKASKDIQDKLGKLTQGGGPKVGNNNDIYMDPNDPMKFFQDANGPKDDILQIALLLAAIYLVVKLLESVERLG